jgi:hypothetical protein
MLAMEGELLFALRPPEEGEVLPALRPLDEASMEWPLEGAAAPIAPTALVAESRVRCGWLALVISAASTVSTLASWACRACKRRSMYQHSFVLSAKDWILLLVAWHPCMLGLLDVTRSPCSSPRRGSQGFRVSWAL